MTSNRLSQPIFLVFTLALPTVFASPIVLSDSASKTHYASRMFLPHHALLYSLFGQRSHIESIQDLLERDSSSSPKHTHISWISPNSTSSFAPGDALDVRWRVDGGGRDVVSPSFKLCAKAATSGNKSTTKRHSNKHKDDDDDTEEEWEEDDEDNDTSGSTKGGDTSTPSAGKSCGASVWPTVDHLDGVDHVQLTIPQGSEAGQWYIMMEDNFGAKMRSPAFGLGGANNPKSTAVEGGDTNSQAPLRAQPGPPTSNSDSAPASSGAATPWTTNGSTLPDPAPSGGVTPANNSGASGTAGVTAITPASPSPSKHVVEPVPTSLAFASRSSPPVAAFAVPLSLVGAILLLAALACWRHSRREKEEKAGLARKALAADQGVREKGTLDLERDVQRIVERRERDRAAAYPFAGFSGINAMPLPLFMPQAVDARNGPYRDYHIDDGYTRHPRSYGSLRRSQSPSTQYRGQHRDDESVTQEVLWSYNVEESEYPECLRPAEVHVRHPAPGRGRMRMDTGTLFGEVDSKLRRGP